MISSAQIRLVQTARAWLAERGVDEDTFRKIMEQETGVLSAKLIPGNDALNRLLRRLKKLGFESTSSTNRPLSADDPITRKQRWLINRNYGLMGYNDDDRRKGFNRRQCGDDLPWGEPQTIADGEKIIEGQKAILRRLRAKGEGSR